MSNNTITLIGTREDMILAAANALARLAYSYKTLDEAMENRERDLHRLRPEATLAVDAILKMEKK